MKSSLVSATSVAALLAFEVMPAHAATIFTLNPGNLGFGDALVNCATCSDVLSETATNQTTGAEPMTFGSPTAPFSGGGSGTLAATASSTVTMTYTFAPTVAGAATAQVVTVTGGAVTKQKTAVTLTGTGVAPIEATSVSKNTVAGNGSSITGNSVNLGYVLANNAPTSASATITVQNTGNGNLATDAPTSVSNLNGSVSLNGGAGYSGPNGSSISLNDGNSGISGATTSAAYSYTFNPTGANLTTSSSTVTLQFSNGSTNGQNQSQSVVYTVTGTSVAPVASVSGANAGYVLAGQSQTVLLTVQNTGNGNLSQTGTISNLHGSVGAASGLFSGSGGSLNGATGIGDTSSTTFSYVFAPTSATFGAVSSNVTGTFNYGTGNAVSLGTQTGTLTGTGVAPISNVVVSNPGYVLVNSAANSQVATVTVSNIGNGSLSGLGSVSNLQGTQGASNSVFVGGGGSINLQDANASTSNGFATNGSTTATFTYNFAPTATGAASTTVTSTFTNSQGPNGTYATGTTTVTLTGTGVAPINQVSVSNTAGAGGSAGTGNLGYLLVTSQTGTATITLSNIGNGNLAGSGAAFNLNGSISNTVGTGFAGGVTGPTSTVSLNDSHYAGSGATTSQTYSYTFAPSVVGAATTTLTAAFSNGSNDGGGQGYNNAQTVTTVLTATGVAPIQSVSTGKALSRVNDYALYTSNSGTGTATITVQNTGDGNLSGLGTVSNLQGTVGSASGAFSGSSVALGGGTGLTDGSTQTVTYSFAPTARGAASTTVTVDFVNGNSAGTNLSQSVQATVTGQGVGPAYQSTFKSAVDTPMINGGTAHAGNIAFSTLGLNTTETVDIDIGNISTDPGGDALTDLTLVSVSSVFGGTDPSAFTIGSYGSLLHEGDSTFLPITVTADTTGTLTGYFTITTDENAPLGDAGDTFTYAMSATVVPSLPEPASWAIFGAGVAGLGFARRRKAG